MNAVSPLTTNPSCSISFPYAAQVSLANLPGGDLSWLVDGRSRAMAGFVELGLPSQKVEEWRYSNLSPLANTDFTAPELTAADLVRAEINERFGEMKSMARLVFVNGWLDGASSELTNLPVGVRVLGLADAIAEESDLLKTHFCDSLEQYDHALALLNSALTADGCLVILEQEVELELELLFIATPDGGTPAYHPRISILVGAGSRLSLREQHATLSSHVYWSNSVTNIKLDENARMCHYRLQEESGHSWLTSWTKVRAARGAFYDNFIVATGGRYSRNEIEVALEGEGAGCDLSGGFMLMGEQKIDNRLRVDHAAPNCISRQSYKGVLDERAHGVFQAKTVVRRDAQRTDGNQLSRALLLSPEAVMDAKPELEIYADDVKCSHGATVGELDVEQLFYLRARGIDEASARNLLIAAFLEEHVQSITEEAACEWLASAVTGWIARRERERAT